MKLTVLAFICKKKKRKTNSGKIGNEINSIKINQILSHVLQKGSSTGIYLKSEEGKWHSIISKFCFKLDTPISGEKKLNCNFLGGQNYELLLATINQLLS